MDIFLEGDMLMASAYIGFAKSKLRMLASRSRKVDSEKYYPDRGVTVEVFPQKRDIRIKVVSGGPLLFIADSGGTYEYHDDLDHYRYGLKAFNLPRLTLKKQFDPWNTISVYRRTGALPYYQLGGVSYYKRKVYTVDQGGIMDVFSESGTHLEEVSLWNNVNPAGGKSQNAICVRADKIFVSANYNGNFYKVYEFDMEYNYIREYPLVFFMASYGSAAIAVDTANSRVYLAQNGFFVGEHYEILMHDLETGAYLATLPWMGTEDILCGGLSIHKGILYSSDVVNRKLVRYDLSNGSLIDPIDCSPFLPSWMPLKAVAVEDSGIWITAFKTLPGPTELEVYVKKLSLDGLTEIKSVGEFMGDYSGGTEVWGTDPPKPYRFNRPAWMDMKTKDNP